MKHLKNSNPKLLEFLELIENLFSKATEREIPPPVVVACMQIISEYTSKTIKLNKSEKIEYLSIREWLEYYKDKRINENETKTSNTK